jgi:hypothetical protein
MEKNEAVTGTFFGFSSLSFCACAFTPDSSTHQRIKKTAHRLKRV